MTFTCPEWELPQIVNAARDYGYDGVEIRVEAGHKHGVELSLTAQQRDEVRRRFEEAGVAVSCVATSVRFSTNDPAERDVQVEILKRYCDLAADLGARRVRVFGGRIPEGVLKQECKKYVAESLAQAGPYAWERGVYVCLETHDDFSLAADVADTLSLADAPGLAATWDWQHPFTHGETIEASFAYLSDWVQHTHVHDVRPKPGGGTEIVPMGEGVLPLREIARLLRQSGYSGYLSMECWPDLGPPEETLPRYLAALRALDETP